MRSIIILSLLVAGPVQAERDAELDALLGDAEASTQDEKAQKKNLEPLFVIPIQPIWNSVEPDVVEEAFKHIAGVLKEDAGFKVRLFRQKGRLERGADPSARVAKKYFKEMAYAETLLKLNKPGKALRAAKPVLRKMWQNARHIRGSDTYCRCLAVMGEAHLRMGQKKQAQVRVDELVTRCDGAFLNTTALKYSQRFNDMLKGRSAALEDDRSASLTIHADLPKAQILLNGRPLGEAPLTITDLPKGRHLIGVVKRDHRAWGATPVLKPGEDLELRATVTRGLEDKGLRSMYGTLRDNRIDRDVMRQATQMLRRKGGGATLGILGVLGRDGQKIRMTLFGFNREGRALRLKQADFGQDFLTVNLAMMGVAEKLAELKSSGGRSLVAGEPLISGLRKGSWSPKKRRWVSMRDDRRAVDAAAASSAEARPRGPLARRKGKGEKAEAPEGLDRIERAAPAKKKKSQPADPVADAKEAAERKQAAQRRQAAKLAASQKAAAEQVKRDEAEARKKEATALQAKLRRDAEAKARAEASAKRWALWRARLGRFLSPVSWREQQPSLRLVGLRISQELDSSGGVGNLDVGLAHRMPSVFARTHWRYGLVLGLSTSQPDFTSTDRWNRLEFPFLEVTRDSEDLAEGFRHEGGIATRAGLELGLDRALGSWPLRLRLVGAIGAVARESTLIHEQYVLEDGERVRNTGVDLRSSDPFTWAGVYWSGSLGLEYVEGRHRGVLDVQWMDTILRTVESFGTVEFPGELNAKVLLGLGYWTSF